MTSILSPGNKLSAIATPARRRADQRRESVAALREDIVVKIAVGALVIVIGLASSTSAFSTAAIGLRASLDNCTNAALSPPKRISACNQIIRTNLFSPMTRARVIASRGNAHFAAGDLESALDDYNKAVELDPGFQPPVVNRDVTLVRLGKCEEANADFAAVLAEDSRSWRALYGRSLCKARAGDRTGAQSDAAQATAINSRTAQEFGPTEIPRWYR